jgi:ATP-dependent Lon protease
LTKECLGTGEPFGVVLSKKEESQDYGESYDDLYHIGTTAHITAVEHLDEGRMNLITVGQDRFVIKAVQRGEADYLIGQVDPFPIEEQNPQVVNLLAQQLRPIVERYIGHLADASGEDLSEASLPADPKALAFLAGTAIQGPLLDKQRLLSSKSLDRLIADTVTMVDREDQILVYMLRAYQTHQEAQKLPFVDYSLN